MSPLQIAQTKQALSLVGRTRDALPFFYCAAGEDGLPILLAQPGQVDPRAVLKIVREARRKVFVRGQVERAAGDGALLFRADGRNHIAQFVSDLDVLDGVIPGLKLARVDLLGGEE
ncbi:MAG: hypothetical protein ACI8S6_003480 [Myxococcota bacterium]|jgi:hypothetical protein